VKDHVKKHATLEHYEKVSKKATTAKSGETETYNGDDKTTKGKATGKAEDDGDGSELS